MNRQKIRERLEVKELKLEHLNQFNALLRYAFQVTNQELVSTGWQEDEIKQSKCPILQKADVIGWFDGDKLVSQIAVYPMKVNIQNRIYDMGGVTGVTTYPEYANFGLMKELIGISLNRMKDRGQTVSFLYPYSIPYYRKKGWEIVSDKMDFSLKDYQLPKYIEVPGMVERVELESEDLKRLYNEFATSRHGCLIRDNLAWEEYYRWETEDIVAAIYYDEKHNPTGFIIYWIANEIFNIKEMVYLNEEARHGIWNFIGAHFSMVTDIRGNNYTNESLAFFLEDSEIVEKIRPNIMARIVDVEPFLKAYNFNIEDENDKITFNVTDPMVSWNNGKFTVDFSGGKINVYRDESETENVINLDINTLTTMLLSYKIPTYLKKIGRINASNELIQMLESIIPPEEPYFSDYF